MSVKTFRYHLRPFLCGIIAKKEFNKRETLHRHIFHLSHTDLDGYSCQLIIEQSNHTATFFNANYGAEVFERLKQIIEAVQKLDRAMILITDLNLNPQEAEWLDSEVAALRSSGKDIELQLLDHHATGAVSADKYEWYYLDTSRSATKITYEFVKDKGWFESEASWMSSYVDVVNAVDIWLMDEHDNFEYGKVLMRLVYETRELGRVMFSREDREYKLTLLSRAARLVNEPNAPILLDEKIHIMKKSFFRLDEDNTLDNLATRYIVELLGKRRERMSIFYRGYRGFLSYGVGNTSIVGNGFLLQYPEYDFIIDVSGRGTMSLRANNGVDVSIVAKELANGGGHPNASGAKIRGFKEQFVYDKVKLQIEELMAQKEPFSKLPLKS